MFKKTWMSLLFAGLLSVGGLSAEVVVRIGPPRPIVERRGPPPGRGYLWLPGYHRWDGRAYAWAPGRWELPPRERARWVPHHWVRRGDGWVFVEGHWR